MIQKRKACQNSTITVIKIFKKTDEMTVVKRKYIKNEEFQQIIGSYKRQSNCVFRTEENI